MFNDVLSTIFDNTAGISQIATALNPPDSPSKTPQVNVAPAPSFPSLVGSPIGLVVVGGGALVLALAAIKLIK